MTALPKFAATADRRLPVAGIPAGASAFASYIPVVKLHCATVQGLFPGNDIRARRVFSPRGQIQPGGSRATPATFGEAGSRSQRARATQPSAWSAPDGLLIVMDASQPLASPTQAGGGHFIAQRHRRFLPA